jgi:hypothetical protein
MVATLGGGDSSFCDTAMERVPSELFSQRPLTSAPNNGNQNSGPLYCSVMDSAGCVLNRIQIPTCESMDTTGDVVGGAGAVGTIVFGVASLTSAGASSPVTVPGLTLSKVAWAAGNLLNILAKHGIGCTGTP